MTDGTDITHEIDKAQLREHLVYLDKVLFAASEHPEIKKGIYKSDFYDGLKLGKDEQRRGVITHLYETQQDLIKYCLRLEKEIEALRQDAQSYATALNNIHKYLDESSRNQKYYNQPRWYEVSNTLSKYGEY